MDSGWLAAAVWPQRQLPLVLKHCSNLRTTTTVPCTCSILGLVREVFLYRLDASQCWAWCVESMTAVVAIDDLHFAVLSAKAEEEALLMPTVKSGWIVAAVRPEMNMFPSCVTTALASQLLGLVSYNSFPASNFSSIICCLPLSLRMLARFNANCRTIIIRRHLCCRLLKCHMPCRLPTVPCYNLMCYK